MAKIRVTGLDELARSMERLESAWRKRRDGAVSGIADEILYGRREPADVIEGEYEVVERTVDAPLLTEGDDGNAL